MEEREALVALNLIEKVGPVRVRHLVEHFGSASEILSAGVDALVRVPGVGSETAAAIAGWESTVDLSGELRRIREYGCGILVGSDEGYPPALREIYDPPLVLYVRGRLEERDRNAVALVGSREATAYGTEVARRLAYQLAASGVTVVSGGARGVDTAGHQGALSARGRTIAVMGTGLDRVFPAENAALYERIASQGAILTQFPFGRPADKQSFPIRNRIVAGMSLGTVVVEAGLSSGALITVNFALEYGRQVFAVPGRIDSPRSKGCHDLIKKGATLCEGVEDILSQFEYLFPPSAPRKTAAMPAMVLSAAEESVMGCLAQAGVGESLDLDTILRTTGLGSGSVSVALLGLEMKRLIRVQPGRCYVVNTERMLPG